MQGKGEFRFPGTDGDDIGIVVEGERVEVTGSHAVFLVLPFSNSYFTNAPCDRPDKVLAVRVRLRTISELVIDIGVKEGGSTEDIERRMRTGEDAQIVFRLAEGCLLGEVYRFVDKQTHPLFAVQLQEPVPTP